MGGPRSKHQVADQNSTASDIKNSGTCYWRITTDTIVWEIEVCFVIYEQFDCNAKLKGLGEHIMICTKVFDGP